MTTLALLGYRIGEAIYIGTRTLVYRGRRKSDNQPVVIKFLNNPYPTSSELLQFRNEYTITKNLNIPNIVRPESLESCGNSYALVMKDSGGISLSKYAKTHALELTEILTIAMQVADILHDLHQNRVIHKDIKPANLLIHRDTKQIQLIDFSIASLLPKETLEIKNPERLEGTLAYLAPEQTGRMNRGIDYRSDFYALGVTLFELLARQLPFPSDNPMEVVHHHLAKKPPSLARFNVPEPIEKIVNKLMAKNAEERYQSALGLYRDLENCWHQLRATGKIEAFELGTRDLCDRFNIPEKLYGRETEAQAVLDAFERVSQGNTELMLVAGFSGIGKTATINEVHKPIVKQRGYFIKGKFDQFGRNIPFSAFVQAFRDLMRQLASENNEELDAWKAKIIHATGESGQVIIDVIPELEWIIGKQPPLPELSGIAAQNRFNLIFEKFISVFATKEYPLTIFLDDLQWADSASLNLLQLLISKASAGYLLVLGAYRDNEVFPGHPLMLAVEKIQKAKFTVNTITLKPLREQTLNQLVADTMSCTAELAQPLTHLVHQKTQGNPFFATQFLKALQIDGLIEFQAKLGYWQCNMTAVRELALTSDVVEFMALQLQKLPLETQKILKLAACIGNQFDLNTLACVSEKSYFETAENLWTALQEGLIIPISETYKFFQSNDSSENRGGEGERGGGGERVSVIHNGYPAPVGHSEEYDRPEGIAVPYKFLHDRVQQAAYSLIPENQKQATHLKIGQLLLKNTTATERNEKIFEIVNQLNAGRELIAEQAERDELAQLNFVAGCKAKAATACAAAVRYLMVGIELLGTDSWARQYELVLNLHLAAAEAEYLNSNFDRSQVLADIALQHTQILLEEVRVYEVKINSYIAQTQLQKAMDTALQVLEMLGIGLESESPKILRIEDLSDLPEITDPQKLAALRILSVVGSAAYIANPLLSEQVVFTEVSLCMRYGNSPIATYIYGFYGLILCGKEEFEAGYQFARLSLRLLDRFNVRDFKSIVFGIFNGYIRHWKEHIRTTIEPLISAYYSGLESGELRYSGYSILNYCNHLFFAGEPLHSVEQQQQQYIDLLHKHKLEYHVNYGRVWQQTCLNLLGLANDRSTLTGTAFDEREMLPITIEQHNGTTLFAIYVAKSLLSYLFEEPELAIAHAREAAKYEQTATAMLVAAERNFYYSLAMLARYPNAALPEKNDCLARVAANQVKMQMWVHHAPMNFLHKWHLVEAEKHRVLGKKSEAIELYDIAISGAKANEYIQEEALANELAAKFYLNWGKERIAASYVQSAYYCYAKWGAKAKTDEIENRYSQLLQPIFQQASTLNLLQTLSTEIEPSLSIEISQ